jgi:DnaK suppressor protein
VEVDAEAIRQVLEDERDDLRARLAEITATPRDPMGSVSFGKRVGEGTTQAVERLNQVGTAKQLSAMLEDVERALEKLREGTYGVCDSCGIAIPPERLEARPWSVLCVDCSAERAG